MPRSRHFAEVNLREFELISAATIIVRIQLRRILQGAPDRQSAAFFPTGLFGERLLSDASSNEPEKANAFRM
jgi:hypothetical protein